jgi:hypothetical protein
VDIECDAFLQGAINVLYTVTSGDTTLALITTHLMAAINAAINVQRQQVADTMSVNLASSIMAAVTGGSDLINIQWQFPLPPLSVTVGVSGPSNTVTLAAAAYDDGEGFAVANCTVTAPGNIPIDICGTWMKAAITAYTSDTGGITAIVQTSIP